MLTVKEWDEIRRSYHIEEKSINEIAQETGHAWRTIKRLVESEEPPKYQRKKPVRARKLGPYHERIKEMLAENEHLPRKQRWTSPRIMKEIQKEGYAGAESTVRHYVAQIRREKKKPKVFLPLEFDPGTDAQVDWGEGEVVLKGQITKVQLFHMKLSYSRRSFVMAFPGQKQEAFLTGHVEAFNFFEGIPQRISYDNLKTAVLKILKGKKRVEQERFYHFRGYYLFESHFCTPGAGHEKGRVEHSVGFQRRHYLVPRPEVSDYEELNRYLHQCCLGDDARQVHGQETTIGEMWAHEQPFLRPLPLHAYDCGRLIMATLNRYSQIQVETNRYSVPVDLASAQLTVKLYPFHLEIYAPHNSEPIAQHARCYGRYEEIIDPYHYLPLLRQRPGAFFHAKPLRQWQESWPDIYHELQERLQRQDPEQGLKTFINILYLHRTYTAAEMKAAIQTAVELNTLTTESVQLYLTQNRLNGEAPAAADLSHQFALAQIGRQPLNLGHYDQFVGGSS